MMDNEEIFKIVKSIDDKLQDIALKVQSNTNGIKANVDKILDGKAEYERGEQVHDNYHSNFWKKQVSLIKVACAVITVACTCITVICVVVTLAYMKKRG